MTVISEGGVFIPRKIGWAAVLGGFGFLISLAIAYGDARANISRDIEQLELAQTEARLRGDDIRVQLKELQSMRLTVVEVKTQMQSQSEMLKTQMQSQSEMLKEIRELARRK